MPRTANPGQPGSGQHLDLTDAAPSPGSFRAPLDRISTTLHTGRRRFGTDIQIKGDLRGPAEYLVLCRCGALITIATAGVCWIAGLEGWSLLTASLAAGTSTIVTGIWYLSRRLSARSRPTRRRTHV